MRPPTSVPVAAPRSLPNPLISWHLLSLDGPTVAVLWTIFPAQLTHTAVPHATLAAMALAVWTLYAADRLLDTNHLNAHPTQTHSLEARHLFHHRHRRAFLFALIVATLLLAIVLPHLARAAVPLYLAEAALMAGYFVLIHAMPTAWRQPVPKELLVGLFFAAATFIPTIARAPVLRPPLFPCAVLFALLCTLNCLFIHAWENPRTPHPHALTRTAIRVLPAATLSLIGMAVALAVSRPFARYAIACAMSATLLLVLHRGRAHLDRVLLRAAADATLLTPILFLHR